MTKTAAPTTLAAFPVALGGRVFFAAWCWILSLGFFAAEAIVQAASKAPYSMVENYISDLGATRCGTVTIQMYEAYVCSPMHGLMNTAYVTVGALAAIGALLSRPAWPAGKQATTGLALVGIAGIGAVIAGAYPEDVNLDLHLLGALLAVPMSNIGMLLLALSLRRHMPALAIFTGLMVLVGLTGLVLTTIPQLGIGIGLTERLAGYPFEIWKTVIGTLILIAGLRRSTPDTNRPATEPTRKRRSR
ncbi:MAG: DUF998 domain-containing protein [Pseudonocardiaceae bacterium]|nr:DUF998 domain-containing protein [Pseudonocardiaceae bacterium]